MLWLAIFQRPVGFDPDTFQGPFLTVLYVLVYVLPIGFAQLFFLAREASRSWPKWAMAAFLFILSAGMAVGALVASVGMWWPQLTR